MRLITLSLLILSLFFIGGLVFKSTVPSRCTTIMQEDYMFVLTGDSRRIPFAMRKLRQNKTTRLYIIGAGDGAAANFDSVRVITESSSKNTYQNAVAIKNIVDKQGLGRIVLITTEDHYNRAKYLLNKEIPDVEIAPCPVPLTGMTSGRRLERWTTEYIKYIGTMFGIKEMSN